MEQTTGVKSTLPEWFLMNNGLKSALSERVLVIVHQAQSIGKTQLLNIVRSVQRSGAALVLLGRPRFIRSLLQSLESERRRQQRSVIESLAAKTEAQSHQSAWER